MDSQPRDKFLYVIVATLGLFLVGRFLGMGPLDGSWSISHWSFVPSTYPLLWTISLALVIGLFVFTARRHIANRTGLLLISLLLLVSLAAFWYFRLETYVYGAGHLRIAQIAQAEVVVLRWFEYGTVLLITWLASLFRAFNVTGHYASGHAWQALAFLAAAATGLGAFRLATLLAEQRSRQLLLFILAFWGGNALLYFGFIGVEVVIAPVVMWFTVAAVALWKKRTAARLLWLWVTTGLGIFLLFNLIFLLPAAVFFTVASVNRRAKLRIPTIAGLVTFAAILAGIYWQASQSFAMQVYLLFPDGKMPFSDYGLLSQRHLSEWFQLLFLGSPLLIAALAAVILTRPDNRGKILLAGAWFILAGGLVTSFVLDPIDSIVLDFPRLAAYLSPISVCLALMLGLQSQPEPRRGLTLAVAAAFALMLPLATIAPYRDISVAEAYTQPYLKAHDAYYRTATIAFRDAHFYLRNWEESSRWERLLVVYSPDQMNLRGTEYLAQNEKFEDALTVQYRIIAKFPYWAEPRGMAATNQIRVGRAQLAKPQIDTALMLEPLRKEHWSSLAFYYRDLQNYSEAMKAIRRAEALAPSDLEIQANKLTIYYRMGSLPTADSLADALIAKDSTRPFPYLIKAFVADRSQNPRAAVWFYEKYIDLGPFEPDVPRAKTRVEALKMALEDR